MRALGLRRGGWASLEAHLLCQRRDRGRAGFQLGLTRKQVMHLPFEGVLIEKLPARHPVDLRAHGGEAILIGDLHVPVALQESRQDIVAEDVPAQGRNARRQGDDRDAGGHGEGEGTKAQGARASLARVGQGDAGWGMLSPVISGQRHGREISMKNPPNLIGYG